MSSDESYSNELGAMSSLGSSGTGGSNNRGGGGGYDNPGLEVEEAAIVPERVAQTLRPNKHQHTNQLDDDPKKVSREVEDGGGGDGDGEDDESIVYPEPSSKEARRDRWRAMRNIVVISLAFMLHFTAFQATGNLQSSMNKSKGTASLAAVYGSLILSNMFLPVVVIKRLGCKWAVAVSFIAYMPYIGAQVYPQYYTLIPAGLLVGFGGGPLWCGKCTYLSVVSEYYAKIADGVDAQTLVVRFFGIFFMIFQCSQIWGNLISSAVISGAANSTQGRLDILCGSQFMPEVSSDEAEENLEFRDQTYILAGIFLGCMILAVITVSLLVDSLKRYGEDNKRGSGTGVSGIQLLAITMKLCKEKYQLLLIPMIAWLGVEQAFMAADFTQAYVSCGWGVGNVGYVMICYGACNAVSAIGAGWIVKMTGRVPVVVAALLIHLGLIITLLCWAPDPGTRPDEYFVCFLITGFWGICDGVWLVQINAMCGILFPGREEAAYSNFRLWESLGFIISYAYSPFILTSIKIYILLVWLVLGILGYFYIEYEVWQKKKEEKVKNT